MGFSSRGKSSVKGMFTSETSTLELEIFLHSFGLCVDSFVTLITVVSL